MFISQNMPWVPKYYEGTDKLNESVAINDAKTAEETTEKPVEASSEKSDSNYSNSEAFRSPAAELLINSQMMSRIRSISRSAVNSSDTKESRSNLSDVLSKCSALASKVSNNTLSSGERTYIQNELDYMKRNLTELNIAV